MPKSLSKTAYGFSYGNYNQLLKIVNQKNIGVIKNEVCRNTSPNIKFLKQVRDLATKKNIILILMNVQLGLDKILGEFTYFTREFLRDLAIFGKALGNGYPITAVIGKDEIMSAAKIHLLAVLFGQKELDQLQHSKL